LYLAITYPKNILAKRIAQRLDKRLKHGTRPNGLSSGRMLAEVRRLHASGVSWKRLESFGLEYCWLARYLQGKISRVEMREMLLRDIIAYSKRQTTWLRQNKDVIWI